MLKGFLVAIGIFCLVALTTNAGFANPSNLRSMDECNDSNMTRYEKNRCLRGVRRHNQNAHKSQGNNDPSSYGQPHSNALVEERNGVNQLDQQRDGEANKDAGAGAANSLGMQLTGIGTALVATGTALQASLCHCGMPYIASGLFFLTGAAGSFGAGSAMAFDADVNYDYGNNLDDLANFDGSLNTAANTGFSVNNRSNASTPVNTGFRVDESVLNNGKLGQSLDALEKLGFDREEFMNTVANGGDVGELLANKGLFKDKDTFNKALEAQKINQAELFADFKDGKYDEFGNLIEGSNENSSSTDYADGGKGLKQGESSEGKAMKPGEEALTFDSIVAQMMKKVGKNKQSLKDILGVTGKGSKKKGVGKEGNLEGNPGELDNFHNLSSDNKAKYALNEHTDMDSEYEEKTLFKRVHLVYKIRAEDMLSTDWYIRNQVRQN